MLPAKGLGAIYGRSGGGKTFAILSMAMSVATGALFAGRHETQRRGVVYIPLEGKRGVEKRLIAYRQQLGITKADFSLLDYPLDVCNPQSVAGLIHLLGTWKTARGASPALVIFDTLARAMPGRKENAPEDMSAAVQGMSAIQAAIDGLVLAVHHTGKDEEKGARGHSSFFAALDVALVVRGGKGEPVEVIIDKMKDGPDDLTVGTFTLESCVLGQTRKGKDVTSAVVKWSDQAGIHQTREAEEGPDPQQQALLNHIDQIVLDGKFQKFRDRDGMPDGLPVVAFKDLLERVQKAGDTTCTETTRSCQNYSRTTYPHDNKRARWDVRRICMENQQAGAVTTSDNNDNNITCFCPILRTGE